MQSYKRHREQGKVIDHPHTCEITEPPLTNGYTHWSLWSDRFQRFVVVKDRVISIAGETDGITFADAASAQAFGCSRLQTASCVPVQVERQTYRVTAYARFDDKTRAMTLLRLDRDKAIWGQDDDIEIADAPVFLKFGVPSQAISFVHYVTNTVSIAHVLTVDNVEHTIRPDVCEISSNHWSPVFRRLTIDNGKPRVTGHPRRIITVDGANK